MTTIRTDVHRPSAIEPADYRFVAFDYLRHVQADDQPIDMSGCTWLQSEIEKLRQDMVATGGSWSEHAHGGNCMVCGNANAIYTAAFHHHPSNTYVRMGSDCSHHVNASLDHEEFTRFRNRVSRWLERENRVPQARAELERRGLGALGQFCGSMEVLPEDYTIRTIADIVFRLTQYGSLTERQWNYLAVLRDRWATPTPATPQVRPNRFAGTCSRCQQRVEENAGTIERVDGRWTVHHLDGQCPQPPATPAANNVGELSGIMTLFDRARQHLQYPAVVLDVPGRDNPIRVSVAGPASRYQGQLMVLGETRNYGNRRPFIGRIDLQGNYHVAQQGWNNDNIVARLRQFAENPAQVAGEYGRLHGRCCFCRLPLTDERSTAVGYGAICAGHYGLPWGDRPAQFAAPVTDRVVPQPRPLNTPEDDAARRQASARRMADINAAVERRTRQEIGAAVARAQSRPQTQLNLNFDAGAERQRRINLGIQCPGCEGVQISNRSVGHWACQECGVTWSAS